MLLILIVQMSRNDSETLHGKGRANRAHVTTTNEPRKIPPVPYSFTGVTAAVPPDFERATINLGALLYSAGGAKLGRRSETNPSSFVLVSRNSVLARTVVVPADPYVM